jgi:hypothetical protein
MAGGGKAKQGIVPMVNRENGFSIVGSHKVQKIGIIPMIYGSGSMDLSISRSFMQSRSPS